MAKKEPTQAPIPMSSPDLTAEERRAVAAVLQTPRLSMGPEAERFEAAVRAYVGVRHAVAVACGTAGLHLCLRALAIADGDLVLTTPFSFVASANVMLYERAVPVFADVDPETGNLDPALLAQAAADLRQGGEAARRWLPRFGARPEAPLKGILVVDVFGQPADYDRIAATAQAHGLPIIEDSCESLGSSYKGRAAGTLGDIAAFAFYPNKQMTTGEGGVVVTDRDDWARLVRALTNQGRAPGDSWLEHTYLGYNYRLDEMSAALGRIQMTRLEKLLAKRERVATWYRERLTGIPGVEPPAPCAATTRMSWFVYVVRLAKGIDRDAVIRRLSKLGIPSRPYFSPIHLQAYFVERFGYRRGDYPVAEDLGDRSLALPFSSVMRQGQVDRVTATLQEVLRTG